MTDREQWFINRIGKRVFRETNGCPCEVCKNVTDKGLVIADKMHALYLYNIEGVYNIESEPKFTYKDEVP